MKVKRTETEIKRSIRQYLNKLKPDGKFISYCPVPYGEPGTPDIIGCYDGDMWLFEVKKKGGKITPLQSIRIKQWDAAGAKVFVVYSLQDVKKLLREFEL